MEIYWLLEGQFHAGVMGICNVLPAYSQLERHCCVELMPVGS